MFDGILMEEIAGMRSFCWVADVGGSRLMFGPGHGGWMWGGSG